MHRCNVTYGNINRMLFAVACLAAASTIVGAASGDPWNTHMTVQESAVIFEIAPDNMLPWASISGTVTNQVPDHPVIIQIYDNSPPANSPGGAVRFAQVEVTDDGIFEYRFRVLDAGDGMINRIFEGSYTAKIFKVVYSDINRHVGV